MSYSSGMMLLLACLLTQATDETYDLATFEVPAGTRKALTSSVTFTDVTGKSFVQYMVTKSTPGSGDPAKDFEEDWALIIAKPYSLKGERKSGSSEWPGGWTLTLGASPAHTKESGDFAALLAVFSGHGTRVAVQMNFNDEAGQAKVDKFLNSIRLAKPAPPPPPPPPETPAGAPPAPPLKGRPWYRAISQYSNWGYNPSLSELHKISNQGYSKWTYEFKEDGTYAFVGEHFSMNKHTDYWFHEESGVYTLEGERLRLDPRKAVRALRTKEGKAQADPVPIALEAATYRARFHYFSGIGQWNLILTPEGEKETRRDGPYGLNPAFPMSYFYSDPPARR